MSSDLELVEESDDERPSAFEADDVEFVPPPGGPPPAPSKGPLRVFDPHEAPETVPEIILRGAREGVAAPIVVLYMLVASPPLIVQKMPWVEQPLPLPGQALCSFVLCFCLLERARSSKFAEREMDVLDMASLLWRTLLFLFPLALGLGNMPPSAYVVAPLLLAGLPLLLGTLAADVWGEFHPVALWAAFWETPNYLATALCSGLALAGGMAVIWAMPNGSWWIRGPIAVLAFGFAGAVIGAARRDAELLGSADGYY